MRGGRSGTGGTSPAGPRRWAARRGPPPRRRRRGRRRPGAAATRAGRGWVDPAERDYIAQFGGDAGAWDRVQWPIPLTPPPRVSVAAADTAAEQGRATGGFPLPRRGGDASRDLPVTFSVGGTADP